MVGEGFPILLGNLESFPQTLDLCAEVQKTELLLNFALLQLEDSKQQQ